MGQKKRDQKNCWEIAVIRARQARRQKKHPILIGCAFIISLLPIRAYVMQPAVPHRPEADNEWPISDYERGYSTLLRPHGERYRGQPSLKRLMRDLRRPGARDYATKCLLDRIDDIALRGWIIRQIDEDHISRLATHVRPSLHDEVIIASWLAEMKADHRAEEEVIDDAATQAELMQRLVKLVAKEDNATNIKPKT